MKKYLPAIITLGLLTIAGAKFLTIKEYGLFCLTQGHAFFGAVRCLEMGDILYCRLSQCYEYVVAAPDTIRYICASVIVNLV
jgi:hypothetical protein